MFSAYLKAFPMMEDKNRQYKLRHIANKPIPTDECNRIGMAFLTNHHFIRVLAGVTQQAPPSVMSGSSIYGTTGYPGFTHWALV